MLNKIIVGALAFATGVIVERKYNVSDRIMDKFSCSSPESDEQAEDTLTSEEA